MRGSMIVGAIGMVAVLACTAAPASAASQKARDRLDVYAGEVSPAQVADIVALGIDRQELGLSASKVKRAGKDMVSVSAIISGQQAAAWRARGSS